MSLRAGDLLQQIRVAWEETPYPGDDNLAGRSSGCPSEYAYVEDYFRGKHWTEITPDGLSRDYPGPEDACLSFMSPRAFLFYLPAFMTMAVQYRDHAPDSAVPALCPPRENPELYRSAERAHREAGLEGVSNPFAPEQVRARRKWWNERTAGFGAQQQQAIVSFLEYMLHEHSDDSPETDRTLREALDHWKEALKS